MKTAVHGKFVTGQCDGWKNVNKASIVTSTINVEYSPYLLNTTDISALPKITEQLLKIVMTEIAYATNTLKVKLIAWCSDVGGDSANMRHLLVQKLPNLIVVDCWAHQVNLIVRDIFKVKETFIEIIDDALEQKLVGQPHSLVLPVLTQWTSHFLSVCQLLQLEPAFKQMLAKVLDNDHITCAGSRADMERKAQQILDILQHHDFWYKLQIVKWHWHLEPLAIAANATQSNYAWLDVVLVTLVILYHKFSDPTLNPTICEAAQNSLEKCWKKADQDVFILMVILNLYLWVACFLECSPYQNFSNLWHRTLQEYISEMGRWSAVDMGLDQHAEQAKCEVCVSCSGMFEIPVLIELS
ncbi:hypothetical protein PISMIDRAFT_118201 [Pisolithus microcarpus 441]|uniref:DUF659 domain-containing protein n=1 Tax=Pisolithus microcarpus 441 TaxID=765257 RepID=A0A0C9Z1E5_9AGAM|nr:hypothetical protein PISMIDRAFT_118201 [Pisolithus microcarpus 441]